MSDDGEQADSGPGPAEVVEGLASNQQALAEQQARMLDLLEQLAARDQSTEEFADQFAEEFREYLPGTEDADGEHTDDGDREPSGRMFQ